MRASSAILVALALLLGACAGEDPNLTESGRGRPVVSVTFPENTEAGESYPAELVVENPGPGAIEILRVAFTLVGPKSGQSEFPTPLVQTGIKSDDPDIVSVTPEPRAVSQDGLVLTFDGMEEGETRTISFVLRVPDDAGPAANSIQVEDGREPERAAGVRVDTEVSD